MSYQDSTTSKEKGQARRRLVGGAEQAPGRSGMRLQASLRGCNAEATRCNRAGDTAWAPRCSAGRTAGSAGASTAFRPVAVGVGGAERGASMSQGAYRRVCGAATPKGAAQRGCSATGPTPRATGSPAALGYAGPGPAQNRFNCRAFCLRLFGSFLGLPFFFGSRRTGSSSSASCFLANGLAPDTCNRVSKSPDVITVQPWTRRSEEHTSELQSPCNLVCRLLLEKNKTPRCA